MDRPDLDYAGLFDASPNPYLVLDRCLNIVGANRAYLAATQRELADLVGRWAWDAFPTDPEVFTTKPIGQGMGLGLSQLYGFVRQGGGFVRLDSAPGRGTTVRLYLPRHEPVRGHEGQTARPAEPEAAGVGGAVLLVEDDAAVRAVAAERLREVGHAVLEAADGPAALRPLRSGGRVDVLVTDVGLPGGMNGRQLAEAARELRPDLPVLFITGYAGPALDGRLAPGMEAIGKPFALDDLATRVRAMPETSPAS